jgi:hypothetical protein
MAYRIGVQPINEFLMSQLPKENMTLEG